MKNMPYNPSTKTFQMKTLFFGQSCWLSICFHEEREIKREREREREIERERERERERP